MISNLIIWNYIFKYLYHVRSQIKTMLYYSICANAKKKNNLKHVPIQNKTILKHVTTQNKTILKHVPMQNVSQINQFCFMCGCKIYLKSIPFWLILHILYIEPYTVQLYITTVLYIRVINCKFSTTSNTFKTACSLFPNVV